MKLKFILWFGILLILETGLLHIMNAQREFEEVAYMGYLFVANFFGSLVAAFGMYYKQRWGWRLGAVIAAGAIAGYIWSRTLGMPGMEVEEWITPYGVVVMTIETAFIVIVVFFRPWNLLEGVVQGASFKFNRAQVLASLALLAVVSASTYQWDKTVAQAYGQHVVSLDQVLESPELSFAELEDQYGVQVSLAAISMMNSIVDVRLKVIDPDKATALFKNQAALLVEGQELVLAPHQHAHGATKRNKIHFIFFPTENNLIHTGSKVSLVFGLVRVEPVVVK